MNLPNDVARCDIVQLGTKTPFGIVESVGLIEGERYYWLIDEAGGISMLPADIIEPEFIDGKCPERMTEE